MLEACIDKRTGEIIVTKPSGWPWSQAELDGPVLCVVQMHEAVLPYADIDFGRIVSYPTRTMMEQRYVKSRKEDLAVDELSEREMEMVANCRWPMLFRVSDKEIHANAKITSEHQLSAHTAVPVFDLRMMAVATSIGTSTIIPAGGGDYTTLAAWWAAKAGGGGSSNVAAWAECYGGGNMAIVDLTGEGYTPTVDYYTRIYPASGQRHDGVTNGAYLDCPDTDHGFDNPPPYTRIEGIRVELTLGGSKYAIKSRSMDNILIDGCLVKVVGVSAGLGGAIQAANAVGGTKSVIVRNCMIYGNNAADAITGIYCQSVTGTANITLQNNSLSQVTSSAGGTRGGIAFVHNSGTLNITSINNIATGHAASHDFEESGTPAITQTYCLSGDTTADDWGGAGNLADQTAADVFVNVASDLNLKDGSPAIEAGANLYATFTTDAKGKTRPSGGPWDMGGIIYDTAGGGLLTMGVGH